MQKFLKIIGVTLFSAVSIFSLAFSEETFTITTYYPSPYGSYNELTTTGNTYLATTSGSVGIGTTAPDGKLEVSGRISQIGLGYSTYLGYRAGYADDLTDNYNTGVGYQALRFNTAGYFNTASGVNALLSNTTGYANTASGMDALFSNTTGHLNTASGMNALRSNTTGHTNTASGVYALYSNTTGYNNTASGMSALHSNTTGYYNTASGMEAGRYISGGAANTTSNNSLYLGYDTKALASGDTNEIVIGASAVGVGSNSAVLGNNSITKTILKGSVGIGTTSPSAKLAINGGLHVEGDSDPGDNNLTVDGNLIVSGTVNTIAQQAWQTPTLFNTWVRLGLLYAPARYFKDSMGIVHFSGTITGGTGSIFLLPLGYRPAYRCNFPVMTQNGAVGWVQVSSTGGVMLIEGSNLEVSLEGITFKAEE